MKDYLNEYAAALNGAMQTLDSGQFEKIISLLAEAYKNDKQIFIAGNGGSAASANHFVCDFGKNATPFKSAGPGNRRFRIISVSDNIEKITAIANDIALEEIFRQQLINLMRKGDVLIAVSASGNSPNIVRACEYAKEMSSPLITLSGFNGGKIKDLADAAIVVPLTSYEQIEDIHLMILHMIVYYFKNHPEVLGLNGKEL